MLKKETYNPKEYYKLFGKKVEVTTIYDTKIIGVFTDDFEDDQEIFVGLVVLKYNEIKDMKLAEESKEKQTKLSEN